MNYEPLRTLAEIEALEAVWNKRYPLKTGERGAIVGDILVVAHPDRQPKIVHADGHEELLTFTAAS